MFTEGTLSGAGRPSQLIDSNTIRPIKMLWTPAPRMPIKKPDEAS
jgi:hypothetical protein